MATGKTKKFMLREFKDQLPVPMTERQLLQAGQQLAQVEADLTEFYGEKTKLMKELKEKEEALEDIRRKLAANIREKHELRDVPAQAWVDPSTGLYWEVRLDKDEVYNKRPMTDEDRQGAFPLGGGE